MKAIKTLSLDTYILSIFDIHPVVMAGGGQILLNFFKSRRHLHNAVNTGLQKYIVKFESSHSLLGPLFIDELAYKYRT